MQKYELTKQNENINWADSIDKWKFLDKLRVFTIKESPVWNKKKIFYQLNKPAFFKWLGSEIITLIKLIILWNRHGQWKNGKMG